MKINEKKIRKHNPEKADIIIMYVGALAELLNDFKDTPISELMGGDSANLLNHKGICNELDLNYQIYFNCITGNCKFKPAYFNKLVNFLNITTSNFAVYRDMMIAKMIATYKPYKYHIEFENYSISNMQSAD